MLDKGTIDSLDQNYPITLSLNSDATNLGELASTDRHPIPEFILVNSHDEAIHGWPRLLLPVYEQSIEVDASAVPSHPVQDLIDALDMETSGS